MQVKVTEIITDYEGKPLKTGEAKITPALVNVVRGSSSITPKELASILQKELDKEDFTYRVLISRTLNTLVKGEILSSTDKSMSYEVTKKLFATNEPDFTDEQVKYILDRSDKIVESPLFMGRLRDLFAKKE